MTDSTRRQILGGLAFAAVAGTAAVATAPEEAPELIAMGDKLPSALDAYRDASKRVDSIVAEWSPQWPTPHPDTVSFSEGSKPHADILGRGIPTAWKPGGFEQVRNYGTPESFEASARHAWAEYERKMATKSQRGAPAAKAYAERFEACIEPARAYWSEVERITEASGITAAKDEKETAREALRRLVGAILTFDETTTRGLVIKAEALKAWSEVPQFDQMLNVDASRWAKAMADTVLRQAIA